MTYHRLRRLLDHIKLAEWAQHMDDEQLAGACLSLDALRKVRTPKNKEARP